MPGAVIRLHEEHSSTSPSDAMTEVAPLGRHGYGRLVTLGTGAPGGRCSRRDLEKNEVIRPSSLLVVRELNLFRVW